MSKVNRTLPAVAALILTGVLVWLAVRSQQQPPVVTSSSAPAPSVDKSAPPPAATPPLRYPIDNAQGEPAKATAEPLPSLDASDAPMTAAVGEVVPGDRLERLFNLKEFARRIVATVDNLPRSRVPPRVMAVRPAEGPLMVKGSDGDLVLDPRNEARYARYVELLDRVDLGRGVAVYVHFYPLLQQAYRDLGYPNGYFNDRVIEAIDDLLAAPVVTSPVQLAQPHVLYTFADPALEARSAGQKIMMRMGPANAERVKARLRELRQRLTGLSR